MARFDKSDEENLKQQKDSKQESEISKVDIVNEITTKLLMEENYKLIPNTKGNFAYNKVYTAQKCLTKKNGSPVGGVITQKLPSLWTLLDARSSLELNGFINTVAGLKTKLPVKPTLWADAIDGLTGDRSVKGSSIVHQVCYSRAMDSQPACDFLLNATLTKRPVDKAAPQTSWFHEDIMEVNPMALLPMMRLAEAKMFMLHLGRIVVGASDTTLVNEDNIVHDYAQFVVLVGGAGVGKSHFLNNMREALTILGYTSFAQKTGGRFDTANYAPVDLAYNDDFNDKALKAALENEDTKSLVSNDFLKVESKGADAVTIRATCALLANTNSYNQGMLSNGDEGLTRRFVFLAVHDKHRLSKVAEDMDLPYEYSMPGAWTYFADNYTNGDQVGLMMYFLARCKDYFLDTLKKDGCLTTLTDKLKTALVLSSSCNHAKEAAEVMFNLACLSIAEASRDDEVYVEDMIKHILLNGISISAGFMATALWIHSSTTVTHKATLKRLKLQGTYLRLLRPSCKTELHTFLSTNKAVGDTPNLSHLSDKQIMTALCDRMVSTEGDGVGYPTSTKAYQKHLSPMCLDVAERVEEMRELVKGLRKDGQKAGDFYPESSLKYLFNYIKDEMEHVESSD
jgi:hypothetical protein